MPPKRRKDRYRTRQRFTGKRWIPYVAAIGQISLAWNSLHEKLASIFQLLLDRQLLEHEDQDEDDPMPMALWLSADFDRPKRRMLEAIILVVRNKIQKAFPKIKEDVLWILKKQKS